MMFGVDRAGSQSGKGAARALLALPHRRFVRVSIVALCAVATVALTGCGAFSDGAASVLVDPGKYTLYHCNDMIARRKALLARQAELRALMDKASEGTGGKVIGTLAYRSDYEAAVSDERLLERNAADIKCNLVPPPSNFQSDQTIR